MKVYKLPITQEECDKLEVLSYQTSAKQNIIVQVLTNPALANINEDLYASYMDEYIKTYMEYEITKSAISKKYTMYAEEYGYHIDWRIDFSDCQITVEVEGINDDQLKEILKKYGK